MQVLVTAEQIRQSIDRLAAEINRREEGRPLTVIAVLTGSIIFLADLIRQLKMPLRVGVIQAKSYAGTERGSLAVNSDMLPEIAGRDVLVLDDILTPATRCKRCWASSRNSGPARSAPPSCCSSRASSSSRCGRTTWDSKSRTCLSSATGSITTTPFAICLISPLSNQPTSPPSLIPEP
jgi:hypothetical protein